MNTQLFVKSLGISGEQTPQSQDFQNYLKDLLKTKDLK